MDEFTVKCAWCGKIVKEGGQKISHTICPTCKKREIKKLKQDLKDRDSYQT